MTHSLAISQDFVANIFLNALFKTYSNDLITDLLLLPIELKSLIQRNNKKEINEMNAYTICKQ